MPTHHPHTLPYHTAGQAPAISARDLPSDVPGALHGASDVRGGHPLPISPPRNKPQPVDPRRASTQHRHATCPDTPRPRPTACAVPWKVLWKVLCTFYKKYIVVRTVSCIRQFRLVGCVRAKDQHRYQCSLSRRARRRPERGVATPPTERLPHPTHQSPSLLPRTRWSSLETRALPQAMTRALPYKITGILTSLPTRRPSCLPTPPTLPAHACNTPRTSCRRSAAPVRRMAARTSSISSRTS